jgi:hypothetical protein
VRVKLVEPGYCPNARESDVADGMWRAANDGTAKLRFPAGADAPALAAA